MREPVRGQSSILTLFFEDLMDALPGDSKSLGHPLKSLTFLPQPGDVWVLSGIDLRVRMGMFEEELTPGARAILDLTGSQNDSEHLAQFGLLEGFAQLVERTVGAIGPSHLL